MREPIAPSPRNATLLIVSPSLAAPTQGGTGFYFFIVTLRCVGSLGT
jgi:hypothetical protein